MGPTGEGIVATKAERFGGRPIDWDPLVEAAIDVTRRAYAPHSGFSVGAALLGLSGAVFTGCNVENASFPLGSCAEQTAVCKAISEGERSFSALVVYSSTGATPCGACRQVLREFCEDLPVLVVSADGERRIYQLSELLPHSFGPADLPD